MTSQSNESLLKAIIDVQNMVINHDEPSSVFESMLGKIIEITGSLFGFMGEVFYSSEKKPFLKAYAISNIAWNDETRALYEMHLSTGLEFHNLDTLFGAALKTGEPVISNDPSHDQRSTGLPAGHPALTSFLCLPVKNGEKLIGYATFFNPPA
jgi:GAF domain-containing protein